MCLQIIKWNRKLSDVKTYLNKQTQKFTKIRSFLSLTFTSIIDKGEEKLKISLHNITEIYHWKRKEFDYFNAMCNNNSALRKPYNSLACCSGNYPLKEF